MDTKAIYIYIYGVDYAVDYCEEQLFPTQASRDVSPTFPASLFNGPHLQATRFSCCQRVRSLSKPRDPRDLAGQDREGKNRVKPSQNTRI